MLVARRVLFIIAGILKIIAGGVMIFIGALIFLVESLIRDLFAKATELLEGFILDLAKADPQYEYLASADIAEQLNFVVDICKIFAGVVLILGAIILTFGIIKVLFFKRTGAMDSEKKKGIWTCVGSWIFSPFTVSTILFTVGICLHKKKPKAPKGETEIESYQV